MAAKKSAPGGTVPPTTPPDMESMTPAERAKFLYKASQPARDKRRADEEAARRAEEQALRLQNEQDLAELAMLRRRVVSAYEDVPLSNGDTIRVRTGLAQDELEYLITLIAEADRIRAQARTEKRALTPDEGEAIDEIERRKVEVITYNDLITADWLREHPNDVPIVDLMTAYHRVMPLIGQVAAKPQVAARFRDQ